MPHASIYVTAPDAETARRLARALLERRLVACANLLPIESFYHWKGRIEESREVAMLLKTRAALVGDVVRAVEAMHPYEVPCVVAFAWLDASAAYAAWVDEETRLPLP